jgi:hypothetical protein
MERETTAGGVLSKEGIDKLFSEAVEAMRSQLRETEGAERVAALSDDALVLITHWKMAYRALRDERLETGAETEVSFSVGIRILRELWEWGQDGRSSGEWALEVGTKLREWRAEAAKKNLNVEMADGKRAGESKG